MFGGQIVAAYPKNIVGCFSAALHGQDAKKYLMNKKGSLWISISASKICGYILDEALTTNLSVFSCAPPALFSRPLHTSCQSNPLGLPLSWAWLLNAHVEFSKWQPTAGSLWATPQWCKGQLGTTSEGGSTRRNFGRWWRFEFYDKARLTCAMHHSWTESKRNIDRLIGFWVPQCGSGILQIIIWCQSDQTKGKNEQQSARKRTHNSSAAQQRFFAFT